MKKILLVLISAMMFSVPAWAIVDINTATKSQLESLDGVGPKKAQAIIDYRTKNGPFKTANDLDKVPGFGAKTVDGLKKDISVGNAKAAAPAKAVKAAPAKPVTVATKPAATPEKAKK
jgi:competence protein ComEA